MLVALTAAAQMLLLTQQAPPPRNRSSWQVVSAAVIKGSAFKNSSVAWLAAGEVVSWADCERLCAGNSTCTAFDFVGGSLAVSEDGQAAAAADAGGINEGDCWFRLDGLWELSPDKKRNHTSGRLVTPPPPVPVAPKGSKNVLFVIFDDYRAMHKTYGWSQPHLPNADAFAKESLVFDRAYVQQAVCGPSRASLMSGRRPDRTQMWNFEGGFRQTPGADKWNTWPQWFWKHGWYSAGCGKLYHPGDPANFDPQSWSEPQCKVNYPYFGQGSCPVPKADQPHGGGCSVDPVIYPNATFPDEETLKVGLGFLRKASAQRNATGMPVSCPNAGIFR